LSIIIDGSGSISGVSSTGLTTAQTVTQSAIGTNVAGTGPAMYATTNYATTINNNTTTAFTTYTSVSFDTASAFNSTTGKFTPQVAGYYQVNVTADFGNNGVGAASSITAVVYKNATVILSSGYASSATSYSACTASALIYLNGSTDYVQAAGFQNSGGTASNVRGYLSVSMVRAA
jgi:ActR/RegA family two-component response regulator